VDSGIASARIPIDVGDSDLENLPVVVAPNFKIPVRLVFETSDPSAAMRGVQFIHDTPIGFGVPQGMKSIAGGVGEIDGIGPGDYRISRSGPGYIQSARLGSADVLKDGLHLDHQPEDFLEVVIGETTASVEGRVTDGTRPVSNAIVVLVPSSNLRQRSDLYYYAATDGNGHFQIQARIVPGDYKVLVLLLQSDRACSENQNHRTRNRIVHTRILSWRKRSPRSIANRSAFGRSGCRHRYYGRTRAEASDPRDGHRCTDRCGLAGFSNVESR